MTQMVKEFKEFIATGNLVELAVAFVLGLAVKAVIDSFVNGVVMQIVAAIAGKPNFDALTIDLDGTPIYYGTVITTIVNLLVVGVVLFFMLKAYNKMKRKNAVEEVAAPAGPTEVELLVEIRDALRARG